MVPDRIDLAGLTIRLHDVERVLVDLRSLYADFQSQIEEYTANRQNPYLCRAGCSHCCKSGAVFAVTLAEAVLWQQAIADLPAELLSKVRADAELLLRQQRDVFARSPGPADVPGQRDDAIFNSRLATLNATHPACPLLLNDLCSVYDARPMLCRAYGLPVDAYAVHSPDSIVFRSLCVLYQGMQLSNYVRAQDLKARLADLSKRLAGGHDWGRFTSSEAILGRLATVTRLRVIPADQSEF